MLFHRQRFAKMMRQVCGVITAAAISVPILKWNGKKIFNVFFFPFFYMYILMDGGSVVTPHKSFLPNVVLHSLRIHIPIPEKGKSKTLFLIFGFCMRDPSSFRDHLTNVMLCQNRCYLYSLCKLKYFCILSILNLAWLYLF